MVSDAESPAEGDKLVVLAVIGGATASVDEEEEAPSADADECLLFVLCEAPIAKIYPALRTRRAFSADSRLRV